MTSAVAQPTPTDTACRLCEGRGVRFDRELQITSGGSLRLCSCAVEACLCNGQSPHMYWDEESRRQWCPCVGPRRRLRHLEHIFKHAEIPRRYRFKFRQDWATRAPDGTALPHAEKTRPLLPALIDSGADPDQGLVLHGPPGTGKTLFACIVLNELMLAHSRPGQFLSLGRSYFQRLRGTFSESSPQHGQSAQIVDELCQVPYLVLDDFGIQRGTEWEMEMLYDLVDARYGDRRFTVITTNQPPDESSSLSAGRIHSRLQEMCRFVVMTGPDFRAHTDPFAPQETR